MKTFARIACAAVVLSSLAACTAGSADAQRMAQTGEASQFLLGVWHGLIAPVTLLVEVVNKFAPHASPWSLHMFQKDGGVLYDLGFYLGMAGGPSIFFFGARRRREVVL